MEDVIFSGTQLRKSVGFAQVTLNIDNNSRKLLIDSDIVSVSRKLFRSGESEYIINGKNVRLKDVVELFMDTGLGRDGYSIIGQGKVADIISSKSNERREIFEEAAGISKFRYKKEEAERRLVSAQDNIVRLLDIIAELEMRVEPLRVQSEKAYKFIELAKEKKDLEISVWLYKLDELKSSINGYEDKYLISNNEYENLENEIEAIENEVENAYKNMQQASINVENLRAEILNNERENSHINAEIAVLKNDINHLNDSISNIKAKQEELNLTNSQSTERITEHNNKIAEIEAEENLLTFEIEKNTLELKNLISEERNNFV